MTLLAEILAYCEAHPHHGPMPQAEPLTLRRHADGSVTVLGPVPDVLDISPELLDSDALTAVAFADGVLTVHAADGDLRYRPLGQPYASFAIRFQRIEET